MERVLYASWSRYPLPSLGPEGWGGLEGVLIFPASPGSALTVHCGGGRRLCRSGDGSRDKTEYPEKECRYSDLGFELPKWAFLSNEPQEFAQGLGRESH